MKTGNAALKQVHDILSIDEIERIMDESKEGIQKQRELDELISGQLTEEDDLAVEAELEEILDVKDKLPEIPSEELPKVPTKKQRTKENQPKIALEA